MLYNSLYTVEDYNKISRVFFSIYSLNITQYKLTPNLLDSYIVEDIAIDT